MAKAASEDTAPWDTLQDALARLGEVFASPGYALEWLLTRIIDGRVRWRSADEAPAGFFAGSWRDFGVCGSDVSKSGEFFNVPPNATDTSLAGGAFGFGPRVAVRGVRVAHEDIARECPEYGAASAPTPSPSGGAPLDGLSLRPREAELRALPMRQQIFWAIVDRRIPGDGTLALATPATVKRQVDLDWIAVRGELFPGCAEGPPAWKTVKSWLSRYKKPDPPR
jgi:hypothetical protein